MYLCLIVAYCQHMFTSYLFSRSAGHYHSPTPPLSSSQEILSEVTPTSRPSNNSTGVIPGVDTVVNLSTDSSGRLVMIDMMRTVVYIHFNLFVCVVRFWSLPPL
jgi:hypothetical protein